MPASVNYIIKAGDEVLAYTEKERRWIPNLIVVNVHEKPAWVNTGTRVVRLHIARLLPEVADDDDGKETRKLLKAMSVFSTGGPSNILITEVLRPNEPRW